MRFIFHCYFSPTFVMEDEGDEPSWNSCKITISASPQYLNQIYGKIKIHPTRFIHFIDHFKLYINDIVQDMIITSTDFHFSVDDFTAGEIFEIHVVAYPKSDIINAGPISSNRLVRTETHKEHFGLSLLLVGLLFIRCRTSRGFLC